MNIYLTGMYENPTTDKLMQMKSVSYAHFSALGTWMYIRKPCEVCEWHWQACVPPLLVQWEPSSDVIGDLSWDGPFGHIFLVKERVADWLRDNRFECEFYDVKYVPPEKKPKRTKCVPYPYEGPVLLWGNCETWVDLDMEASGVELTESCKVCGYIDYTFRYEGITIRRKDWHGEKMFRITTNGPAEHTFVTEEGRRMIEEAGFSNISFTHAGEIVD